MRQGPLRDARVEDATGKRGPYAVCYETLGGPDKE